MERYVCLTVRSQPGEAETSFSGRLSQFWTGMLRTRKDEFEKVYAETSEFERQGQEWTRTYLVQEDVLDLLESELTAGGISFVPPDRDEIYSKYEAVPPEWMQIEH